MKLNDNHGYQVLQNQYHILRDRKFRLEDEMDINPTENTHSMLSKVNIKIEDVSKLISILIKTFDEE